MEDKNKKQLRTYLKWVSTLQRTMETALQTAKADDPFTHIGFRDYADKYMKIIGLVAQSSQLPPIFSGYDLEKMKNAFDTVVPQQKEIFEAVLTNVSLLRSHLEDEIGIVEDEVNSLYDFLFTKLLTRQKYNIVLSAFDVY